MGLFKKKETTKTEEEGPKKEEGMRDLKKSPLKANEYVIHVFEPWGNSKFLRKKLIAKRYEYDDGVVTLQNTKANFEEIFPSLENNSEYLDNIKDIDNKLITAKANLKKILTGKDKKTNIKNVKYEIFTLEANLHKLKHNTQPAFMFLDENKNPTFEFLRKGSTFHPISTDVDTSKIYVPSDYKKKKSAMTVRNKKEKYGKYAAGLVTIGSIVILIAGIVMTITGGVLLYKGYTYSDSESAIAKINARFDNAAGQCLDVMAIQNKELAKTTTEVSKITEELNTHLVPTTIIEGTNPVDFK